MKTTFWGVRGSIPAPGPETNRYGGNTACVSIRTREERLVILDAGTGIASLGSALMKQEFGHGKGRAAILLGHAHWDHIQGFPFFPPVYVEGNEFDIYGGSRASRRLEDVLEGQMNPHFSPIQSLKNLGATIRFHSLEPRLNVEVAGLSIRAAEVPHGVTRVLSFRIKEGDRVLVYTSDAGYPEKGITKTLLKHYNKANVLIHDCTYTPEDQLKRRDRGFSSIEDAAKAAVQAQVEHLVMFHYDQDYNDDDVDRLKARLRKMLNEMGGEKITLTAAAEGMTLDI